MSEPAAPSPEASGPGRRRAPDATLGTNTVELLSERSRTAARARREPEAELTLTPERSVRPGDLPDDLRRRYLGEPAKLGRSVSFFEGPGAKRAAFHDHGGRLQTDQTHPTLARDMASIAAHRGWSHVRVRGEDEFRRQAWLEARSLGLDVSGYRPRQRDEQELEQRAAAERSKAAAREERRTAQERPAGVRERDIKAVPAKTAKGVILETGRAPYRRREGAHETPYVRLARDAGPPLEIWGAGLPDALARSGATIGDAVVVRRDGVERIDRERVAPPPSAARAVVDDDRIFAAYDADRFRRASPAQAARDPDLKGAQSHLVVLDAVIDRLVRDPERRIRLHAEARGIVADEMAQGRRFPPARVRDIEPVLAKDIAEAFRREHPPERARAR